MLEIVNIKIPLIQDQSRLRSSEHNRIYGSYEKLNKATGWEPKISIDKTLHDILTDIERKLNK